MGEAGATVMLISESLIAHPKGFVLLDVLGTG